MSGCRKDSYPYWYVVSSVFHTYVCQWAALTKQNLDRTGLDHGLDHGSYHGSDHGMHHRLDHGSDHGSDHRKKKKRILKNWIVYKIILNKK